MKIRNKYTSSIGFGPLSVLPDTIAELPKGFSETHPAVNYYISRNWIEVIEDVSAPKNPAPAADVNIGITGEDRPAAPELPGTLVTPETSEADSKPKVKAKKE
jgi:hypothetical protein